MNVRFFSAISLAFFSFTACNAAPSPTWYRSHLFFGEPRFEEPWLLSLDSSLFGGFTQCARDCASERTPLFDLLGESSMPDGRLFSAGGRYSYVAANLSGVANFCYGFFAFADITLAHARLGRLHVNASKETQTANVSLKEVQEITPFRPLCATNTEEVKGGIGWTINYQDTRVLDYIDTTLSLAALTSPNNQKDPAPAFDVPLGYHGNTALQAAWTSSIGIFDWFTGGGGVLATCFVSQKDVLVRMFTLPAQGIAAQTYTTVRVALGPIFSGHLFIKADHILDTFSCILGYSYDHQRGPRILCSSEKVNLFTPPPLQSWTMHSLHLRAEYDGATKEHPLRPRIGLEFDFPLGGKRIVPTPLFGFFIGLDF